MKTRSRQNHSNRSAARPIQTAGGDPNLGAMTAEAEREDILSERARKLARREKPARPSGELLHVVEFLLAGEHYGFELRYVREVLPVGEITPLPCTPGFVLGLVNVRGEILSVLNLKSFFELGEGGLTDLNKLIVLEHEGITVGVVADAVLRECSLEPESIQGCLPTLTGLRREYLRGVTRGRLAILDAGKILADPRIVVHEEVE